MNLTVEELRRRNQYEHNESNYNLFKERFENLKFELNISLYNTIGRYRKEYEQQHGTGTFFTVRSAHISINVCVHN